jgi:hypothetical protein
MGGNQKKVREELGRRIRQARLEFSARTGIEFTQTDLAKAIGALPDVPAYIKGVINLRGKIVPVIDMRLKFHKQPEEYTDRTCVIVVDTGEQSAGLIVDEVSEVQRIEQSDIVPPPSDCRPGELH